MRIEIDTDGVEIEAAARDRLVRRLEASLGRLAGSLGGVSVRIEDGRRRERSGCAGRDRYEGTVRIRVQDGDGFSLRGEGDDPQALLDRLAERAGRVVRRRVGITDGPERRARRFETLR